MLSYKAAQMGMRQEHVRAIGLDVVTGISAAGTTQGTATTLDADKNFISTAASGSGVVLSVNAIGGDDQFVYNGGSNPMKVYPPSGAQINSLGTNNPMILAIRTGATFHCASTTQWAVVLSA